MGHITSAPNWRHDAICQLPTQSLPADLEELSTQARDFPYILTMILWVAFIQSCWFGLFSFSATVLLTRYNSGPSSGYRYIDNLISSPPPQPQVRPEAELLKPSVRVERVCLGVFQPRPILGGVDEEDDDDEEDKRHCYHCGCFQCLYFISH